MATYTTLRLLTVTILALALGAPAQPSTGATEHTPPVYSNENDAAAYEWAQGMFTAAGFEEPAAIIEFFDSEDACGGARGRAWLDDTTTATIAVCATHRSPHVEETWRRRTLLHELAHAWIEQNVSPANMEAFTQERGLDVWSSRDVEWDDRATEHAAEILMWGIQGGDYKVDFRLNDTSCPELSAGYELLTDVHVGCGAPAA